MKKITITGCKFLRGVLQPPPDKSISHRAVILGAISGGSLRIKNFLESEDCLRTVKAFKSLGVKIEERNSGELLIYGKGPAGLRKPARSLYLGNSGTTMRLLSGLLAGQNFEVKLTGDASLSKRPMGRVIEPLRLMGAKVKASNNRAPLIINPASGGMKGKNLKGVRYKLPIASAQVKSALLLAGLFARGKTVLIEPAKSRDHTERMLKHLGVRIDIDGLKLSITGGQHVRAKDIYIPADISSAAFFLVGAALIASSRLTLKSVGLNPTRAGIIKVLKRMGAQIEIKNRTTLNLEPQGDIKIGYSKLKGIHIKGDIVPRLIDELPVLMVAASLAKGKTIIEGAGELRVKETDRISSMVTNLSKMGARIEEKKDGVIIEGVEKLHGATVKSYGDHRTAMAMIIAGLSARGKTVIEDTECINTSFPGFLKMIKFLTFL